MLSIETLTVKIIAIKDWVLIFLNKKWVRLLILLLSSGFFYWVLYHSLTDFSVPPVEIRNECRVERDGFICDRKFGVETYYEEFKRNMEETYKNQTIVEKLAGSLPVFFQYSVGFKDNSSKFIWIKQHRESIPPLKKYRGDCPFPEDFEEKEDRGTFKKSSTIFGVLNKAQELATALNNCQQPFFVFSEKVDQVERAEIYDIFVELNWPSYISIGVLALSLMSLILGVLKIIVKFYKFGFND